VWLLQKLVEHNMLEESAALLRWLTRVRLKDLERYFLHAGDATEGELPSLSIGIEMDESSHLADHLEKHGAKLTELLGVQLLEIGEQRVREAYELMTLAHGRDDNFDWVSYGRTSIAPSNQDTIAHAEDVLVLMMRQSIDALAGVDPNRIHEFAERASLPHEPTLLRRLGIYALSRLTDVNRDDLLNRAMSLGWPRDVLLRPELYQLLRAHYEHATEAGRERLISDLDNDEWWQGDEYRDRKRFDLSQLFVRVAPNSATTVAFAERQRVQHPAWLEQDRDGFLARVEVGWGGDEPSPIDKETMLGWSAEQARTELARALQEAERSGIKQSILGTFQSAVQTDAEWGTRLFAHISTACSTSGEDAQLIDGISWALRERDLSPDERLTFLRLSAELQWPVSSAHSISSTLEQWSRKSGESKSVELYDAFDRAADAIFDRSRTSKPAIEHDGWFERAINHPAGLAAQIWLTIADTRDRLTGAFVLSTDEQELGRWQRVLNDNSLAGAHARPILGTATERIIAGDPDWAKRILLPRFDPAGGDSAAQLWDGRFFYSRWSWAFVNGVEPFWDEFLRDSRTIAPNRAEKLGDVIALLVAQRAQSHFTLERVLKFVQGTTDEGRRAFADAVPRHLAAITSDERRELWQELLLPYWRARRTNMPSALSPDEVREMITWAPALPEVASVVVSELAATETGPMNQAASIFWTWQEDDRFVREHPNEVLIIVRFLAERRSVDWFVAEAVKTIELAMKHGGKLDGAQAAAESLANATNADQAVDFARRLRGKNGE
jgi:hypothetical protein